MTILWTPTELRDAQKREGVSAGSGAAKPGGICCSSGAHGRLLTKGEPVAAGRVRELKRTKARAEA